jgi:hypothetical protein
MATKLVIITMPTIKTTPITIVTIEIEILPTIVDVNAIGIVNVTAIVIAPATTATITAIKLLTINPENPALDLVIAPEMMILSPMKMNNHF